jgi:hypothetical protein
MKYRNSIASTVLAGFLLLSTPISTLAYNTTTQNAVRLTDTYVLFTIEYRLGFMNRAAITPLFAQPGVLPEVGKRATVGFSIIDDTGATITPTSVAGISVAETPSSVQNMQYTLDYGKNSNFTLFVFAELPKSEREYQLQVVAMPFYLIDKDQTMTLGQIDKNTLENYRTPFVQ